MEFHWVNRREEAQLVVDHTIDSSIPLNVAFWEKLMRDKVFAYKHYFTDSPCIRFLDGSVDYLATAFYLINCIQEYNTPEFSDCYDSHGRFRYENSLQKAYGCIEVNVVQACFDSFCSQTPCLGVGKDRQSRIFLSHDIDTLNGSFLQDGLWAIRRGRFDVILKLVFNELMPSRTGRIWIKYRN